MSNKNKHQPQQPDKQETKPEINSGQKKIFLSPAELEYFKKKEQKSQDLVFGLGKLEMNIMLMQEQKKKILSEIKTHTKDFGDWQKNFLVDVYGFQGEVVFETGEYVPVGSAESAAEKTENKQTPDAK